LWPLSTPSLPKQFVPLIGGRSLFELTLNRLHGLEGVASPIVSWWGPPSRRVISMLA
jgi:mannose-1-phosphate guanylyltransferase